jgi:DNA-binding NtrC family response regulator
MVDSILTNGLKEGDFVEVVGGRGDYNNYAQINIGTGAFGENSRVTKLSSNNTLPAPILLTVKQINQNGEQIHHHEAIEESLSIMDKEKELIVKALKKHKGKRKDASSDLGISERTLYRKLKEYDIED